MSDLFEASSSFAHQGWRLAWEGVFAARIESAQRVALLGGTGVGKSAFLEALRRHFETAGVSVALVGDGAAPRNDSAILLLDDADRLNDASLRALGPAFAVLAARPGFAGRARALGAAIVMLDPFNAGDVAEYLPLRLRETRMRITRFDDAVPEALVRASGGAPRLLNSLIGSAALLAGMAGDEEIRVEHVEAASADMRPAPQERRALPGLMAAPSPPAPAFRAPAGRWVMRLAVLVPVAGGALFWARTRLEAPPVRDIAAPTVTAPGVASPGPLAGLVPDAPAAWAGRNPAAPALPASPAPEATARGEGQEGPAPTPGLPSRAGGRVPEALVPPTPPRATISPLPTLESAPETPVAALPSSGQVARLPPLAPESLPATQPQAQTRPRPLDRLPSPIPERSPGGPIQAPPASVPMAGPPIPAPESAPITQPPAQARPRTVDSLPSPATERPPGGPIQAPPASAPMAGLPSPTPETAPITQPPAPTRSRPMDALPPPASGGSPGASAPTSPAPGPLAGLPPQVPAIQPAIPPPGAGPITRPNGTYGDQRPTVAEIPPTVAPSLRVQPPLAITPESPDPALATRVPVPPQAIAQSPPGAAPAPVPALSPQGLPRPIPPRAAIPLPPLPAPASPGAPSVLPVPEPAAPLQGPAPATASPPRPPLPDSARTSLVLTHPRGDAAATRLATSIATGLNEAGWRVGPPFAVADAPARATLRYFYAEDAAVAARVAETLRQSAPLPVLSALPDAAPLPRPGTLELALPTTRATKRQAAEPPRAQPAGPPLTSPVLRQPADGETVAAGANRLRWSTPTADGALLELWLLNDAALPREVFAGLETAQELRVELPAGRYAWRVTAVSRQDRRYSATPWSVFTVEGAP